MAMLQQIMLQVKALEGPPSEDLEQYELKYKKSLTGQWAKSSEAEFLKALEGVDVCLGGDFHADHQAQRTHLRALRKVNSKETVLALELFSPEDEADLQDYIQGKLPEAKFLSGLRWDERWPFPWKNYRPLLDWAKESSVPVHGINKFYKTGGRLNSRDRFMAKSINNLVKKYPGKLIYVLVGEMHLAHLPGLLDKRPIRLYQSEEDLYFKNLSSPWLRKGNHYCVFTSPPWVKWQNYLMHLEKIKDQELDGDIEYSGHVAQYIRFLAEELDISVSLSGLQVYLPHERSLEQELRSRLSAKDIKTKP